MPNPYTLWRELRRAAEQQYIQLPTRPKYIEKRGRHLRYILPPWDGVAEALPKLRDMGVFARFEGDDVVLEVEC